MLVYREWLDEYIDVPEGMEDFSERMIMSGSNIETVKRYGEGIEKVVVGRLLSVEKHPDADKLLVCMADVGRDAPAQIVTGAPNVYAGAFVPVILDGGKLPGGQAIKKGKLRGVESQGMLCSAKELGYEDKVIPVAHKDGIWILGEEYAPGLDFVEALGLKGEVVEFEITPNRPDCLSMIGMAREAAAVFGGALRYPENRCQKEAGDAGEYIQVEIKNQELCPRYAARIIKDVKVAQSPWWLQKRLMHAGMRPINNIVDITNYVMLEYGQPIHAFDIREIKGQKIIIDTAKEGEQFTTLDGTERILSEGMLLIQDQERPVAIAGVMGGLNSGIGKDTTTIVIESANFKADSIRTTSKKLGLRTEASSRFEKGIDPDLAKAACDRVCYLAELLSAGTAVGGSVDVYPSPAEPKPIEVRVDRVNRMLGIELSQKEMEEIFNRLEMRTESLDRVIQVTPPSVRLDVLKEIDCVEEVARIYGYDRMPLTIPKGSSRSEKSAVNIMRDLAREALIGMGASEIETYSFTSAKGMDLINVPAGSQKRDFIRLINPLGEENSVMRTMLTPHMLEALGRNLSRNIQAVRAFEIGNTFLNFPGQYGLPKELEALCIGCYGEGESFYTLKGMVNEFLAKLGIRSADYEAYPESGTYHPGKCALIRSGGMELGIMGEVHPDVLERYDIDRKAYCAELNFEAAATLADLARYYSPLPRYPSAARDIALLLDEEIRAADVEAIIRDRAKELLEKVALFDVYRGKQIPEGKKSAAFSLTYRAKDRTLTDEEVAKVHDKVLDALKAELGAALREI